MGKKKQVANSGKDTLEWSLPGSAYATLFFSDADTHTAIFVSLMPAFAYEHAVKALIGDAITSDDIMDINGFEQVLERSSEGDRFLRVSLVNRSQAARSFDLAFLFNGDAASEQRYEYTLEANSSLTDTIDVRIVR